MFFLRKSPLSSKKSRIITRGATEVGGLPITYFAKLFSNTHIYFATKYILNNIFAKPSSSPMCNRGSCPVDPVGR